MERERFSMRTAIPFLHIRNSFQEFAFSQFSAFFRPFSSAFCSVCVTVSLCVCVCVCVDENMEMVIIIATN